MGWFDNEKDEKARTSEPVRSAPAAPVKAASPRGNDGSTLGERVHVNGTIVSEESLRILGTVEGKIQARQELNVAKGADVRAVIQGRRVVVEGSVKGDIHASEVVLLGPTASLVGNISTPALHIQEGAFFKGNVEMRKAEPSKPADKPSDAAAGKSADREAPKGAAQKGLPGTVAREATAAGSAKEEAGKEAGKEGGPTAKTAGRSAAAGQSGS